jgi:hypothetical protein
MARRRRGARGWRRGVVAVAALAAALSLLVLLVMTFAAAARAPAPADAKQSAGTYDRDAKQSAGTYDRDSANDRDAKQSAGTWAVALDAWAQGDTVDVLWAAALPEAAPHAAPAATAGDDSARSEHPHHDMPAGDHAKAGDASYALFHARSPDGGRSFGPATRIGDDWATTPPSPGGQGGAGDAGVSVHAPHRGTDPQIAAAGNRVIAVWTSPGTSKWGTGPLAVAISNDGGRTWSRGGNPADDNSTDGHGFIDVAADPAGGFHAVWLDGRDGDTGLRVASSDDGIEWRANASVDAVTCQCCWNDLAMLGPGRLAVLYRDRDPRDMAVAVSEDGARSWQRRGTAGAFGWKVEGCPHVGGGLAVLAGAPRAGSAGAGAAFDRASTSGSAGDAAAVGRATANGRATASVRATGSGPATATAETLHALVWTGAPDHVGLYDVASRDGGRTWEEPRQLGGRGARHGDLAVAAGELVAAWDEGAAIYASRSTDGSTWGEPRRLTSASVRASHPLVIATASGALVLWTESTGEDGAPARWVAARF